ncbi:McrC family protein [Clostridium beijerinckii]|uniref:McrC family protein n=1 Tax=Clostridium beijerinckii TaxID=1520 RepID=UPI00232D1295|nr:McrC family protein [Clostridium beijerinckii]
MRNKYIILREGFDWLIIGNSEDEITLSEYNSLCKYLRDNGAQNSIMFGYNKLKFINYVGIIVVSDLTIEILPKISLSNDIAKDREILMFMLSKCNKLSVNIEEILQTNIINQSLLDILAKVFVKKLFKELQKGLYLEYVSQEESLNNIKGKVLVTQNAKFNAANKSRVYCKYDEFTENNVFNSILKGACNFLIPLVKNNDIVKKLKIITSILVDVDDIYIPNNTLNIYKLNKRNERFEDSYVLAKLILTNTTMNKSSGKEVGFSILFEMNYLYEEYIGVLLKEITNSCHMEVEVQERARYLLKNKVKNRNEIALKPDIVIYKNNKTEIIIDTKWKSAIFDKKEHYTQSDIYQMYAYITTYEDCKKCILLYPKVSEDFKHSVWSLNSINSDKEIQICEIDLSSYHLTKSELNTLISS